MDNGWRCREEKRERGEGGESLQSTKAYKGLHRSTKDGVKRKEKKERKMVVL